MRRAALLAAVGAVALAASACGERSEPTGSSVSPYPVTVQGAGENPTTLDRQPGRIAPLDPAVATMLIELNAEKQLVGLPRRGAGPSIWRLTGTALARALVRLHPDLIVASSATDPIDLARAGRAAHTSVYLIPEESVADIDQAVTQLGLLTNRGVVARALVRSNRRAERQVAVAVENEPVLRVFVDTGGFTTVSSRTLISDVIAIAHGRNVAGRHPEAGVFSLHRLAKLDPQVYLTSDPAATLRYLRSNRKTRKLTAVRTGRVYRISPRFLLPDGDLADRLLGIARLLHPDALH